MRPAATIGLGLLLGLVLVAANAHAQTLLGDGPPGETPPLRDRPSYEVAPPDDPMGALVASDATSDRAFGRSTALSLAPGQFDFGIRTAVEHGSLVSVAAGVSRTVELSADFGYARVIGDTEGFGIKFSLLRQNTWAMAIDTDLRSTSYMNERTTTLSSDFRITVCPLNCNMLFTVALGVSLSGADYTNGSSGGPRPIADVSAIFASGYVRPLIEAMTIDGSTNLGFAGLRIGGRHVGVDIGAGLIDLQYGVSGVGMMLGVGVRP